jgi:hypothetical protein
MYCIHVVDGISVSPLIPNCILVREVKSCSWPGFDFTLASKSPPEDSVALLQCYAPLFTVHFAQ